MDIELVSSASLNFSVSCFSTIFRLMPKELNNSDWHVQLLIEGHLQTQWFWDTFIAIYKDWFHQNCPLISFPSFPIWADLHRTCRITLVNGLGVHRERSQEAGKIWTKRIHKINEGHGTFFGNIIVSEDKNEILVLAVGPELHFYNQGDPWYTPDNDRLGRRCCNPIISYLLWWSSWFCLITHQIHHDPGTI